MGDRSGDSDGEAYWLKPHRPVPEELLCEVTFPITATVSDNIYFSSAIITRTQIPSLTFYQEVIILKNNVQSWYCLTKYFRLLLLL